MDEFLSEYCVDCHSGDDPNGDIDFETIGLSGHRGPYKVWDAAIVHLSDRTMPPEDALQPTEQDRKRFTESIQRFLDQIDPQPAIFRPRRLSVHELRNTLRSVMGFDLEVDVIEAEQTIAERSMVVKLLPQDPPGKSGFKNDTHRNPLTTVYWDQYSYVIDAALEELFSPERETQLASLAGVPLREWKLSIDHAQPLIRNFIVRAHRRPVLEEKLEGVLQRLREVKLGGLKSTLKLEMKAILMAPSFIYRGLLMQRPRETRGLVDAYELAERMSYFLWADMPDDRLSSLAADNSLTEPDVLLAEVERMLESTGSRSLAEIFASEWLTLDQIEEVSNNPPVMVALKSQPIDFMHYLFTEDRPLLELIESQTTFINPHTARMYRRDAKQMQRYVKQRGIEVEIVPNQKITLQEATERGGVLTMPGILAMNKGPILRGTWILERVLGQTLPEPPANVGQVAPNRKGEKLTFRERFEQHREQAACASCHDKIDPLGFALESFDDQGRYILDSSNDRKKKKGNQPPADPALIDTSGQLPSGEKFSDIGQLKKILVTSKREMVVENIVETTLAYALCRELQLHDRPTVKQITQQMMGPESTWRDLLRAIVLSVPFRETIVSD